MRRRVFLSVLASAVLASCASLPPATFPAERTRLVDGAIQDVIRERRMPGAVYHLERQGKIYEHAYGRQTYAADAPAAPPAASSAAPAVGSAPIMVAMSFITCVLFARRAAPAG